MNCRSWKVLSILLTGCMLLSQFAPAQQATIDDLKKQIDSLNENVKAMQKDMQDIKSLLQGKVRVSPPQNTTLDLGRRPVRGDGNAKLTLIAFVDYQCPFCGQFIRETMPQIEQEYVKTGKVRYVVLNLPLDGIHKSAFKAAEATACADEQGKFWEMNDRLFANQKTLDQIETHAMAIGLDISQFQDCMITGRGATQVRSDMVEAQKANLTGTPAFFLAPNDPKSTTIKTVTRLVGAQPFPAFKAAIEKQLGSKQEPIVATDAMPVINRDNGSPVLTSASGNH